MPSSSSSSPGSHVPMCVQADKEGRSVWLISSNVINTEFYGSFGFVSKADVVMGDENPTWTEQPVIVRLVRHRSATDLHGAVPEQERCVDGQRTWRDGSGCPSLIAVGKWKCADDGRLFVPFI